MRNVAFSVCFCLMMLHRRLVGEVVGMLVIELIGGGLEWCWVGSQVRLVVGGGMEDLVVDSFSCIRSGEAVRDCGWRLRWE